MFFIFYNDSVEEERLMIDFWLNIMWNMIRILRWVDDETEMAKEENGVPIQFVILELSREFH